MTSSDGSLRGPALGSPAGPPIDPPATHLERVAVEVAELAAELVRSASGNADALHTKSSPTDVVTRTDMQAETLIREQLLQRCPGSAIVGEEYDDAVGTNGVGWVVDPIDGTVNFLYDLPVVSVSIAATLDGVTVAGAVTDVHRGETFSAARDGGARRDGVPITASAAHDAAHALIGTGFAYDAELRATQADVLTRVLPVCRDIRCMGSAALNLCWVACGRLDGYFERDLKIYDYAAGALIATEATAAVELPRLEAGNLILASAPALFGSLQDLLGERR